MPSCRNYPAGPVSSVQTTIVILSRNDADRLRYSLPAAKQQADATVLLVDNGSTDDTRDVARRHGVEYLRLDESRSYCEAINIGLAASRGDAVLLLNADCFLDPGFVAAASRWLKEPDIGSVSGKLLRAVGPEPHQRLDLIDTVGIGMHRSRKNWLAGHNQAPDTCDLPAESFGPDGAAALYRRETLEDCMVEGSVLDEDLEAWASDVDLAWRARLLGWRSVYEPAAIGHHIRSYRPDSRDRMSRRSRRLVFRNRYLMIAKNDTVRDLVPDLHYVLAYEALVLSYAAFREPHLLLGYVSAARRLRRARRARAVLRRRRAAVRPVGEPVVARAPLRRIR